MSDSNRDNRLDKATNEKNRRERKNSKRAVRNEESFELDKMRREVSDIK